MTTQTVSQTNRRLVRWLLFVVVGMFGFGYAMVPLYDVLCKITGLNGKTNDEAVAAVGGKVDAERTVTVEFVANVNESAPWQFTPKVVKVPTH